MAEVKRSTRVAARVQEKVARIEELLEEVRREEKAKR
jgi:hypothetical protein